MRVVLNSGGHIAGIVNRANPKSGVLTSDAIRRARSSGATARRRDGATARRRRAA
jgi:hypothetical protein